MNAPKTSFLLQMSACLYFIVLVCIFLVAPCGLFSDDSSTKDVSVSTGLLLVVITVVGCLASLLQSDMAGGCVILGQMIVYLYPCLVGLSMLRTGSVGWSSLFVLGSTLFPACVSVCVCGVFIYRLKQCEESSPADMEASLLPPTPALDADGAPPDIELDVYNRSMSSASSMTLDMYADPPSSAIGWRAPPTAEVEVPEHCSPFPIWTVSRDSAHSRVRSHSLWEGSLEQGDTPP